LLLIMLRLGQHNLLAIVVGLWGTSGNTLYCASLGLMWAAFINGFQNNVLKNIIVEKFPYTEANIPSQKKSHVTASRFSKLTSTNVPHTQSDKSHIQNLHLPPNRPEDGYMLAIL
jgi:hypothetical protein